MHTVTPHVQPIISINRRVLLFPAKNNKTRKKQDPPAQPIFFVLHIFNKDRDIANERHYAVNLLKIRDSMFPPWNKSIKS